ncbi:MAG TPA: membrane protein insertion efficiency factor YidD [Geobacteraceae bacterium]|nr:membrane protein insertion efficiency factor YidD [Geobacteraceae bacterium]
MLTRILINGIGIYQKYLSPFLGRSCRFYPSCSHYSVQSLQKYGLFKGVRLTMVRLAKCHPLHPGGYDPVT